MSFTLMRYRDGVPSPIKMSIWDAFKGTPNTKPPKPKPVSSQSPIIVKDVAPVAMIPTIIQPTETSSGTTIHCSCCRKVHGEQTTKEKMNETKQAVMQQDKKESNEQKDGKGEKKDGKSGAKESGSAAKDNKNGNTFSNHDTETYTAEDDKKIIELKSSGTSWAEILKQIGKQSKSQLQQHWKQIDPANLNSAQEHGSAKADGKGDDDKGKPAVKPDAVTSNKAKQQHPGDKEKTEAVKGDTKISEPKTVQGELKSWSDRYDKHKWIAAASRHFDLTGQRITPESAKKLAEQK